MGEGKGLDRLMKAAGLRVTCKIAVCLKYDEALI
jgi:hypothetical protein